MIVWSGKIVHQTDLPSLPKEERDFVYQVCTYILCVCMSVRIYIYMGWLVGGGTCAFSVNTLPFSLSPLHTSLPVPFFLYDCMQVDEEAFQVAFTPGLREPSDFVNVRRQLNQCARGKQLFKHPMLHIYICVTGTRAIHT